MNSMTATAAPAAPAPGMPEPGTPASTRRADVRRSNAAWEALMTAHAQLMGVFAAEGMWAEVSMREYDVLYTLAKAREPLRLSEVQGGVLLSQPALSRMVDRLVARGLLTRGADDVDGRAVRIALTERGAEVQRAAGRAHAKSIAQHVGTALDPDELTELERLCRKVVAG